MNHETGDTPKGVLDRIAGITGDDLSDGVLAVTLNASTPADAVHTLSKIKRILKELRLLKRDVRAQVAAIRSTSPRSAPPSPPAARRPSPVWSLAAGPLAASIRSSECPCARPSSRR